MRRLISLIPPTGKAWLKKLYTYTKQLNRSIKLEIGTEKLMADLRAAGIKPGDTVVVHSSLSSIGNVKGGAHTIIQSIMNTVTASGTILMPCYGDADEILKKFANGETIDLRQQKSGTGKISEVFRTWGNVEQSSHPFSSICAWGYHAKYITDSHDQYPTICHKNSPLGRLLEFEGKIIGIGVSLGPVSFYHVLEDTWDNFPIQVYSNQNRIKYLDKSGKFVERDVFRYDPQVAKTRIDHVGGEWIRFQLTKYFKQKGILKPFKYGDAESWVIEVRQFYDELKYLACNGITIYLTEKEYSPRNQKEKIL